MSADNGIYILKTPSKKSPSGYEYRVSEQGAIDNIYWGDKEISEDPNVWIKNCREWWASCKVYTDNGEALTEACRQADGCDILEYGISVIDVPVPFDADDVSSDEFLEKQSVAEALGASVVIPGGELDLDPATGVPARLTEITDPAELRFLGFCKDFDKAMGVMRKDGCGLTLGQEQMLRKELGI